MLNHLWNFYKLFYLLFVGCYHHSYETGNAVSLNQTYPIIGWSKIFELKWAELSRK
jgi:hypothetical protein